MSKLDGSQTVTFEYNEDGLRTKKTANGVVTHYILHGSNLVHMTRGDDVLHFFYDAQNSPTALLYNGDWFAYVKNLQGDVIGIVNATGTKVVEYVYDAWGKPIGVTGTMAGTLGAINPFRYRGYVYDDETGLYYLRSRYYNPEKCRFLNADKLIAGNLYAYCDNTPAQKTDDQGLEPIDEVGANEGRLADYTSVIISLLKWKMVEFKKHSVGNGSTPTIQQIVDHLADYLWFSRQVTLKASWDVKQEASWKLQFPGITMPLEKSKITLCGQDADAADIGNFAYGFLGSAMGISPEMLFFAGGVTQKLFEGNQIHISIGTIKEALNAAFDDKNGYYGDEDIDHFWIQKGIDCYYDLY